MRTEKAACCMTPQVEEALRLLRLAERDRDVFEILAASVGNTRNAHAAASLFLCIESFRVVAA